MAIPHSSMNSDNPFESNAFNQNPFNQPDYSQYFGTPQNPVDYNENMQAQAPQQVNNDTYANVSATEWFNADGSSSDIENRLKKKKLFNMTVILIIGMVFMGAVIGTGLYKQSTTGLIITGLPALMIIIILIAFAVSKPARYDFAGAVSFNTKAMLEATGFRHIAYKPEYCTMEGDNDGDTHRRKHTSYIKNIIWKPRPERHVYRLCATPAYNSNCSSVIGNVTSILTSNSTYSPVLLETEQSKARLLIPDNTTDNTIGSNNPIKIGGIDVTNVVTNVINMGMNAMAAIGQDSNVRYGGDGEAFLSDSFGDMDGNGVEDNKE